MFDEETLLGLVEVPLLKRALPNRRIGRAFQIVGQRGVADAKTASDAAQDRLLKVGKGRCRVVGVKRGEVNASRKLVERAGFSVVHRGEGVFEPVSREAIASRRREEAHLGRADAGSSQFCLTIAVQHLQRWHGCHKLRHATGLICALLHIDVDHLICGNALAIQACRRGGVVVITGVVHQNVISRNPTCERVQLHTHADLIAVAQRLVHLLIDPVRLNDLNADAVTQIGLADDMQEHLAVTLHAANHCIREIGHRHLAVNGRSAEARELGPSRLNDVVPGHVDGAIDVPAL